MCISIKSKRYRFSINAENMTRLYKRTRPSEMNRSVQQTTTMKHAAAVKGTAEKEKRKKVAQLELIRKAVLESLFTLQTYWLVVYTSTMKYV